MQSLLLFVVGSRLTSLACQLQMTVASSITYIELPYLILYCQTSYTTSLKSLHHHSYDSPLPTTMARRASRLPSLRPTRLSLSIISPVALTRPSRT